MLYLSKKVSDNLPNDLTNKLHRLSPERQTLFEYYYYRFSPKSRAKTIIIKALYECIMETDLVK